MLCLAFFANRGCDRLDVTGRSAAGIQVRCYTCTKTATVPGIILGEGDFLADAKAKVDQMLEREGQGAGHAQSKAIITTRMPHHLAFSRIHIIEWLWKIPTLDSRTAGPERSSTPTSRT
jgi:hypothetical protein